MASNSIIVKSYSNIFIEKTAGEEVYPGMLVSINSSDQVIKHATAGGNAYPMVVYEDALQGKSVAESYAAGDKVKIWIPQRGDVAQFLLEDGQNVSIGDFVESNGLGMIQKHTVEAVTSSDVQVANTIYSNPIVGQVDEAQDLSEISTDESSLAGNSQLIRVRVL